MPHPYASGMVVTEDDDQGWREFRQPVAPTEGRPAEGVSDSAALVAQFLGPLIAYDARRATELTATLAEFLEQGGHLEAAASTLGIHRSTLRYRLERIRELTGLDLSEAQTRAALLQATRAWRTS
jgi:DNA-binding PucR family transcriptional regulator